MCLGIKLVSRPVDPVCMNVHPLEELVRRLTDAVDRLAAAPTAAELELKCFTPAEAARLLGKTTNWVVEAIQAGRIPHTYVGKSPRMTAAHIRWVQAQGERVPNRYALARL